MMAARRFRRSQARDRDRQTEHHGEAQQQDEQREQAGLIAQDQAVETAHIQEQKRGHEAATG
jgi:hypothetical protein